MSRGAKAIGWLVLVVLATGLLEVIMWNTPVLLFRFTQACFILAFVEWAVSRKGIL